MFSSRIPALLDVLNAAVGRRVTVRGEAFGAHTGHHRAPLVLFAEEVTVRYKSNLPTQMPHWRSVRFRPIADISTGCHHWHYALAVAHLRKSFGLRHCRLQRERGLVVTIVGRPCSLRRERRDIRVFSSTVLVVRPPALPFGGPSDGCSSELWRCRLCPTRLRSPDGTNTRQQEQLSLSCLPLSSSAGFTCSNGSP